MNNENIYKIAISGFLHDIGKFAERGGMEISPEFLNNHTNLYQPFLMEDIHTNILFTLQHSLITLKSYYPMNLTRVIGEL